jgi:DNA-binding NtrC family response regulator
MSQTPSAVLLVDDESAVRRVLQMALSRVGLQVLPAANAPEAVALYREHHQKVSLVLLDVQMPGDHGPAALEALRAINPEVRACFMTGQSSLFTAECLLGLGALQVFAKPFEDVIGFAETVRQLAVG